MMSSSCPSTKPRPAALPPAAIQLGLLLVGLLAAASAQAAHPYCRPAAPAQPALTWQILETSNFRVLAYSTKPVPAEFGRACEDLKQSLSEKWLGEAPHDNWSPKCDVVLHPSDSSYLREVGQGGKSTVASSLVDQQRGQIRARRIDVRSPDGDWQSAALPHELTHVILADHFVGRTVPRWIDEGVAILADPADKRQRHHAELRGAISNRSEFRVVELMTLADYPAAERWGTFYGQSASVVEFLVTQRTPADFVRFVQLSFDDGYDAALREVYGLTNVAELEHRWAAHSGSRGSTVRTAGHGPHALAVAGLKGAQPQAASGSRRAAAR